MAYVWQNLEVVKIKMVFREKAAREKRVILENDRFRAEIARARRADLVEREALSRGMQQIRKKDVVQVHRRDQERQ